MFGGRRQAPHAGQQPPGRDGIANRYQLHQQLISIGDDFWIENEAGVKVFRVDGKVLRLRRTLIFKDTQGNELAKIQERRLHLRDTMEIEGPHGESMAVVKKALLTPLRDRFTVKVRNSPELAIQGNILDHEYTIGEGPDQVAEVSKKWFRLRDSYGVEIAPGQDDVVILAVTVVIDEMVHRTR